LLTQHSHATAAAQARFERLIALDLTQRLYTTESWIATSTAKAIQNL
jgi:hypothetical protein